MRVCVCVPVRACVHALYLQGSTVTVLRLLCEHVIAGLCTFISQVAQSV